MRKSTIIKDIVEALGDVCTVNFNLSGDASVSCQLYDANGRLASDKTLGRFAAGNHTVSVPFNGVANGTYECRLCVDNDHITYGKFIILGLKYVDKDWGQLSLEQPAVGFPCALVDIADVRYSELGQGWKNAVATVTVKVANNRTNASSVHAPTDAKNSSYKTLDLCDDVGLKLGQFNGLHEPSLYSPLVMTGFYKVEDALKFECYEMQYKTSFKVPPEQEDTQEVTDVRLGIRFQPIYDTTNN